MGQTQARQFPENAESLFVESGPFAPTAILEINRRSNDTDAGMIKRCINDIAVPSFISAGGAYREYIPKSCRPDICF